MTESLGNVWIGQRHCQLCLNSMSFPCMYAQIWEAIHRIQLIKNGTIASDTKMECDSDCSSCRPSPWCSSPRLPWSPQSLEFLWRQVCFVALGSLFLGPPTQTQQTPWGGEGAGQGVEQGHIGREEAGCSTQVQTNNTLGMAWVTLDRQDGS